MRKKVLLLLFVFSLLLVTPVYVYGDNSNSTSTIKKQVDIGSFDVWKNSAGQWIASEPPKYNEHYRPVEADSLDSPLCNPHILPYVISAPADIAGSVVGVESITFITPNTAVNDYQDAVSATTIIEYINMYRDFQAKDIININSKYLGNGKVEVEYDTKLLGWIESWGEDKTKPWQGGQVSGHRFYMPILVTWKVANVPDFKVWIGSKDMLGKQPGEMITIETFA